MSLEKQQETNLLLWTKTTVKQNAYESVKQIFFVHRSTANQIYFNSLFFVISTAYGLKFGLQVKYDYNIEFSHAPHCKELNNI